MLDVRRVLARRPELVVAVCFVSLVGSVTRVAGREWGCVVLTVLAYVGLAPCPLVLRVERLAEPEVPGAVQ